MTRWQDDKMTRWQDDKMTRWHDDMMTWWHDDMMTWWHDDMMAWWHDDMMTWWWFQKVFTAFRGFKIFAQTFIASTVVNKTVSSTDEKYTKQAKLENDITFTFLQRISSKFPFQKWLATGHNQEDVIQLDESSPPRTDSSCFPKYPSRLFAWKHSQKFAQNPSTPPTPSRLLLPGCSPPLRPPAGLQVGKGWGDLHSRTL